MALLLEDVLAVADVERFVRRKRSTAAADKDDRIIVFEGCVQSAY